MVHMCLLGIIDRHVDGRGILQRCVWRVLRRSVYRPGKRSGARHAFVGYTAAQEKLVGPKVYSDCIPGGLHMQGGMP